MTTLLSRNIGRMSKLVLHPARREAADLLHLACSSWRRASPYMWFVWVAVLSLRSSWKREFHTKGPLHVPGHALIFAVSAFVACRSAQSVSQRVVRCAAVIGFGCALEMLQSWMFGSRFEWEDVLTDACGVLLALLFVTCADSMRKNPHSMTELCGEPVTQATGLSRPVSAEACFGQSRHQAALDGRRCRISDTPLTSACRTGQNPPGMAALERLAQPSGRPLGEPPPWKSRRPAGTPKESVKSSAALPGLDEAKTRHAALGSYAYELGTRACSPITQPNTCFSSRSAHTTLGRRGVYRVGTSPLPDGGSLLSGDRRLRV